jgi:hypothetical protein
MNINGSPAIIAVNLLRPTGCAAAIIRKMMTAIATKMRIMSNMGGPPAIRSRNKTIDQPRIGIQPF